MYSWCRLAEKERRVAVWGDMKWYRGAVERRENMSPLRKMLAGRYADWE